MDASSSGPPCNLAVLLRDRCLEGLKTDDTRVDECACTMYYYHVRKACSSSSGEIPPFLGDWLHQCQQMLMGAPHIWKANRYPRSTYNELLANSTVSAVPSSNNAKITLPIIIAVVVTTNLLLFFCWYRRSAIKEYLRSSKTLRMLSFFCCRHRPLRVRPMNTLSSWSIEDPEEAEELQFGPPASHSRSQSTHLLSGSYSGLPGPSHSTPATPLSGLWKTLPSFRLWNPFKRRPVPVKSMPPKANFEIVESVKPPPQGRPDGHVRLASSITAFGNYLNTTLPLSRTSPNSTSSPPRRTLPKSPWNGTWKNPFKNNVQPTASLLPTERTSVDDAVHRTQAPQTYRPSTEDPAEYTQTHTITRDETPRDAGATTGYTYTESVQEDIVGNGEDQDENSVFLISRSPGVDFSLNFSRSSVNSVHLSTPSEQTHSLSSANYPRHPHSPTASDSSLEQYPPASHSPMPSNNTLIHPVEHAHKSSDQDPSLSHPPNTTGSASQGPDHPGLGDPSQDTINRVLRPSRSNPTMLFPGAVRAAGYLNHNRNLSSDGVSSDTAGFVYPS